jgi:predicted AAA+ superfamily ATPase
MMNLNQIVEDLNPWWKESKARGTTRFPVRRDLHKTVLDQVLDISDRRAVVLIGPRQVGKTVLLLQVADDLLDQGWPVQNLTYFDFSDDRLTEPVNARDIVSMKPFGVNPDHPRLFLLDEIRLSPNWDQWLKHMVDKGSDRFAVTDSAASILREASSESGQGRWDEYWLEGLTFREFVRLHERPGEKEEETLQRLRNLPERYLMLGGFPEHATSVDFSEVRRRLSLERRR